jgi:hypothetical protein
LLISGSAAVLRLVPAEGVVLAGVLPYSSLDAYVRDLKATIPGRASEAFIEPPSLEITQFGEAIQALLMGNTEVARVGLDLLNYDLFNLNDEFGRSYLVAQERPTGFRGQGTYIVDSLYVRNVVIEVPHPLWDLNTPEEGVAIFQGLGARALFIAGTHRCANPSTASGCSGTSTSCLDGSISVRISDAPHFTGNFMYAAHGATMQLVPASVALNLHGNRLEPYPIELSDGTRVAAADTSLVNRLRSALRARMDGGDAGSCNWPEDALTAQNLCGTTNVQGRLSNGSALPCTTAADASSGLFLHLEQHQDIRDNPAVLIDALQEVIPAP